MDATVKQLREALFEVVNEYAGCSPDWNNQPTQQLTPSSKAMKEAFRVLGVDSGISRCEFWKKWLSER